MWKTTLLKTIGLLDKPNGEHIMYKGMDTKEIYGDKLSAIRRNEVAFIFQDFYLMDSLNVEENIVLPMVLNENDVEESITKARKTAKRFGIESLLEKKPSELSGGEKQRVAICRAVAINPELILADEPTGNLDSKASANVIQTLANINAKMGKTVLLVSHDPKVASYCKKIILLKDGLILDVLERTDTQSEFYHRILDNMDRL